VATAAATDESEEELPASIPINSRLYGALGEEDEFFDSLTTTDEIVDQFQNLATTANAYSAPLARNPFDEDFASEEVVFDQYLQFEDQMLASAPRVINRLDTAFAQQLKMCEIEAAPVVDEIIPSEPINRIERLAINAEPAVVSQVAEEVETADFGDILIVEDERPMSATIVSSRNFRQLFSSLEMGSRSHRVG
jgi:anion-transporting  ArsA/GET3 family ATPase